MQELKGSLLEQFEQTRRTTLELVRTLERDDYMVQSAVYTSPPKWHIGHTSWIYEAILSKIDSGYEFYSKEFSSYLNSYYQQFGTPGDKAQRGNYSRPTLEQILEYFEVVNLRVKEYIEKNPDSRLITMGLHHECQHQELLVYDLRHMLGERYAPPKILPAPEPAHIKAGRARIKGGQYMMGYSGKDFSYDIELPEHITYLEDYEMDVLPVTNAEYARFVEEGGYGDYKFWLADGWEEIKKEGREAPMYWERQDGRWTVSGFGGKKLNPREPVCHVSYYEADAYCKWAGKRLPTEAEWEKAALWDEQKGRKLSFPWGDEAPSPARANLLESYQWGCTEVGSYPDGASPCGCHQMIGDVWEWTSSEFTGYPGFKSGFDEYNDKWFANQKVLRGGSFGTPSMSIRASYRNFFRPGERWMFAGFRCAAES